MKFGDIINNTKMTKCDKFLLEKDVKDIKVDSRLVKKGDMFIALKGENFDGNNFIDEAIKRGASVVVSENIISNPIVVKTENARKFYALACKNFFGKCCEKMKVIAITGTNGKTTIASIIYQILQNSGKKTAFLGTFGLKTAQNEDFIETGFTTPDPYQLHKIFKQVYEKGCEYVVMEASAHAIALHKLEGINFEVGLLSNVTEDHLDFFSDMTNYAMAKAEIFLNGQTKFAIFCTDDKIMKVIREYASCPSLTYGLKKGCYVGLAKIESNIVGTKFVCKYCDEKIEINTTLVGKFNVKNMLGAICVLKRLGLTKSEIESGAWIVESPKGRFSLIKNHNQEIIIDYAHTPDGLEKILLAVRETSNDKIVIIFGCGGNRDRQKRSIMGGIASRFADVVILTSDNPRNESPESIIDDIKQGISGKCVAIENRKEAIEFALKNYPDHTIVIAGKGAENYQEICGIKYKYNDFDVVNNFIKNDKKRY